MTDYPFVKCLNPQKIVNKYTGEELVVPCGHCSACTMSKSARLAFQCECERVSNKYCLLVTLTYANSFIPRMRAFNIEKTADGMAYEYSMFDTTTPRDENDCSLGFLGKVRYDAPRFAELQRKARLFGDLPYLRKRDLQLFIKRLRIYLPDYDIRYFACGEYGPDKFRPHFHLLIYVNDPELVEATKYVTLSEFPKWTWAVNKKVKPQGSDKLSVLEYYIRKSWQYGIVDCERIEQGSCSSYVASYVNGSQSVPPFLEMDASKCFCVHSRFLGGALFRQKLVSVLSTSFSDFITRCLDCFAEPKTYTLTYQNYSYYYPKCKGYSVTDSHERLRLYTAYDTLRDYFGTSESVMSLSIQIVELLRLKRYINSHVELFKRYYHVFRQSYIDRIEELAELLFKYADLPASPLDSIYWDKVRTSIYTQLLTSRLFCDNCRIANISSQYYLSKIEDFYRKLEFMHLTDFFRSQEKYFAKDYADDDDLVYFYNNSDYDFAEFQNSFAYKRYKSEVTQLAKDMVKHKLQNDKNNIFSNN